MSMKFAIYSRKSKFTGKGESIANQVELCKEYIKSKNADAQEKDIIVYEDEGYSGKNTHRPKFQHMMKDIHDKKIKSVVCYRLDRISRNVGDCSNLIDELELYGVEFCSINENFDTTTPMGRAMYNICSVFAQLERETIAERIRDNMHELAKTGRWLGGNTPTGYESEKIVNGITVDGKERIAYRLNLIPDEAELIKLVFSKFIEYNSLTKTETYLLQNHIHTKNEKAFTRFAIKAILQNPVYMIADSAAYDYFDKKGVEIYSEKSEFDGIHGLMGYNKTMHRTGKSNLLRDINDWIIAVGKHEGIITGEQWVKAQSLLEQNKSKSYRKPKSNTALLSGILICGNCGSFMRPKMYNKEFENGEKRFSYLCETKEKSKQQNCDIKNPNGNVLDRAICEEIKKLSENSSEFIKQLEAASNKSVNGNDDIEKQIEKLEKFISEKNDEIGRVVESLGKIDNEITIKYINEHIAKLHSEVQSGENRLHELKRLTDEKTLSGNEFDVLKVMLVSFAKVFDTMSIEQKRIAIRTFVKRMVWDGENIHMYLYGSEEPLRVDSK